ncbi:hypothetical protein [Novosphingobium olei]|uniref:Uncharacterized protein n=1 Tax=Novosphingobium olei TaxID=2728851 RepID=A0A7Y0BNX3_9SPHN|nr:hypothetical protein [Novosphingobium olei]NML93779.1 hypothetical protein [Novosphingobium olei]
MKPQLSKTDRFADLLADGFSVADAAARLCWTPRQGNSALQRIRQMLGPQAV